jgi:hypothetical protein
VSAVKDVKALIARVVEGDVMAAVELATLNGCGSVGDLVETVCPTLDPSPALFDVCADGWALRDRVGPRRPLEIK